MSLDMAIRLLKAALPCQEMTLERALELVEYHQRRNEAAQRSHAKRWQREHPSLKIDPLLCFTPTSDHWKDG